MAEDETDRTPGLIDGGMRGAGQRGRGLDGRRQDEARLVAALLVITVSTGMLDAVSLLHLGTFTGYMTGTVILIGIHLSGGTALATPGLIALAAFLLGAVGGGRLVRRRHPPPKLVGDVLVGVAVLVAIAAAMQAFVPAALFGVVAILSLAMGLQTSATRHASVSDMTMPAATMILHGLAHDSRMAGGTADRAWRRVGILVGLLAGAAGGAVLSAVQVWPGLAATAGLILGAGLLLRRAPRRGDPTPPL